MVKKNIIWEWQFSTYSPGDKSIQKTGAGCWELMGPKYPYRKGNFNIAWLAPFHQGRRDYWDKNYTKKEI